jgi:hypothetical protein
MHPHSRLGGCASVIINATNQYKRRTRLQLYLHDTHAIRTHSQYRGLFLLLSRPTSPTVGEYLTMMLTCPNVQGFSLYLQSARSRHGTVRLSTANARFIVLLPNRPVQLRSLQLPLAMLLRLIVADLSMRSRDFSQPKRRRRYGEISPSFDEHSHVVKDARICDRLPACSIDRSKNGHIFLKDWSITVVQACI